MKGSFRRRSRRKLAVAGGVVAALIIAVPTAWAVFDDVPPSSPFYANVNAIQGAGISNGCSPTLFCPADAVNRQQMAAFLARGNGRSSLSSTQEIEIGEDSTDIGSLEITVGGVAGGTQFVKLDAAVQTYIESATGCPCTTGFVIWSDEEDGPVSTFSYNMNEGVGQNGFGDASGTLTTVVAVPTASTQTFRVLAFRDDPTPFTGEVIGYASMSAMTGAFGSTGTNILGAGTASGDRATGKGAAGRLP